MNELGWLLLVLVFALALVLGARGWWGARRRGRRAALDTAASSSVAASETHLQSTLVGVDTQAFAPTVLTPDAAADAAAAAAADEALAAEAALRAAYLAAERAAAQRAAQREAAEREAAAVEAAQRAAAAAAQREAERQRAAEAVRRQAAQETVARETALREAAAQEAAAREAAARNAADEAAEAAEAAERELQRERSATPAPTPAPVPVPVPAAARSAEQTLVLLVDDSKVVRVKTSRLLAKHGFRIALAETGEQALQMMAGELPQVLITDVEMPGIDGVELTRRVRAAPRTAALPVVMITSADERLRSTADDAGVTLLLGKPYADEELVAQVARLAGVVVATVSGD